MRVRYRGEEYELGVNPSPRFGDGPFLGVDLASMKSLSESGRGTPSPPGAPLPEIAFRLGGAVELLIIRDDRSKVEPLEMPLIRRMPHVLSRGGWLILPVSEWLYSPDLADVLRPEPRVVERCRQPVVPVESQVREKPHVFQQEP